MSDKHTSRQPAKPLTAEEFTELMKIHNPFKGYCYLGSNDTSYCLVCRLLVNIMEYEQGRGLMNERL